MKPNYYYGIKIDDAVPLSHATTPQLFRKRSLAVTMKRVILDRQKFVGRKIEVVRLILQEAL
jgi:hypothetical protein